MEAASGTSADIRPEPFAPGMALQLEGLRRALAAGMPRLGWKIGINVPEVLARLELPHPGVAWIDGRRLYRSGDVLRAAADARLHAEPEIAIRIREAVAPECSADAARDCIDALHPALEVVSYARPTSGLRDLVAHCMFHEATVLGAAVPTASARGLGGEWPRLRAGARAAEPPRADLVPEDLGRLVRFAARYLAAFGESLAAGDLLLSGSYTASALALAPGEEASACFGACGEVSLRIELAGDGDG